ncbi:DUF4330 family protein [Halosegnis longus]|uniref:DUF4330 family protein n=1 Tax=Halosegnis longus TaxID=2216012 RepID=A0AAJ4R9P2_9EURY|nr:DUF4330 family protein [Salella cibi]
MQLLDEHGRVFGVVNIIDLLVVLFVVAVGVAGITLVADEAIETVGGLLLLLIVVGGGIAGVRFVAGESTAPDEREEPSTVTVELVLKSWRETTAIESDTAQFRGRTYTVTDVYRTPTENGTRALVMLRPDRSANNEAISEDSELRCGTVDS